VGGGWGQLLVKVVYNIYAYKCPATMNYTIDLSLNHIIIAIPYAVHNQIDGNKVVYDDLFGYRSWPNLSVNYSSILGYTYIHNFTSTSSIYISIYLYLYLYIYIYIHTYCMCNIVIQFLLQRYWKKQTGFYSMPLL
jgi:hypothetical protein